MCEKGFCCKVLDGKDIGAAFRGGLDEFWGFDADEPLPAKEFAKQFFYAILDSEDCLIPSSNDVQWISLPLIKEQLKDTDDAETEGGPHVMFQAVVENARSQSANLAFLVFKQGMSTIQAVVAKNETISKQVSTINASPNTDIRLIFDYRWSNLQLVYQLRP